MAEHESKIVEFGELKSKGFGTECNISDLKGKTLLIHDVQFVKVNSRNGEVEIPIFDVECENKRFKAHSWSSVIAKQAKTIKEAIDQGKVVKAKIIKMKNYYQFA